MWACFHPPLLPAQDSAHLPAAATHPGSRQLQRQRPFQKADLTIALLNTQWFIPRIQSEALKLTPIFWLLPASAAASLLHLDVNCSCYHTHARQLVSLELFCFMLFLLLCDTPHRAPSCLELGFSPCTVLIIKPP